MRKDRAHEVFPMQVPLQITFEHLDHSDAWRRQCAAKQKDLSASMSA